MPDPDAVPARRRYQIVLRSSGGAIQVTMVKQTHAGNAAAGCDDDTRALGKPTTEALHVTERFHRKDFGHLDLQITIDDSKAYTKPWTVNEGAVLQPDDELIEYICEENNRDVGHFVGK